MSNLKISKREPSYQQFLLKIKSVIATGKRDVELRKAVTYWRVGELINQHVLKNEARAGYGKQLFLRLSLDIGIHRRTLERIAQFQREFSIPTGRSQFNWSKYRALLSVEDEGRRVALISKAKKQKLNSIQIEAEVKKVNAIDLDVKLEVQKGILRLGTILEMAQNLTTKQKSAKCLVDLGFKVTRLADRGRLKNLAVDSTVRLSRDAIESVVAKPCPKKARFTYVAVIKKVVDGDTLLVDVDLGLNTFVEQRLRLRGINAAEIKTEEGQKVKRFLQRTLRVCPIIVIQTTKGIDMYARYLTDVFYLKGEKNPQVILENGTYLNQELLNKGLAEVYL